MCAVATRRPPSSLRVRERAARHVRDFALLTGQRRALAPRSRGRQGRGGGGPRTFAGMAVARDAAAVSRAHRMRRHKSRLAASRTCSPTVCGTEGVLLSHSFQYISVKCKVCTPSPLGGPHLRPLGGPQLEVDRPELHDWHDWRRRICGSWPWRQCAAPPAAPRSHTKPGRE